MQFHLRKGAISCLTIRLKGQVESMHFQAGLRRMSVYCDYLSKMFLFCWLFEFLKYISVLSYYNDFCLSLSRVGVTDRSSTKSVQKYRI